MPFPEIQLREELRTIFRRVGTLRHRLMNKRCDPSFGNRCANPDVRGNRALRKRYRFTEDPTPFRANTCE